LGGKENSSKSKLGLKISTLNTSQFTLFSNSQHNDSLEKHNYLFIVLEELSGYSLSIHPLENITKRGSV
jgi:hypothetical protein